MIRLHDFIGWAAGNIESHEYLKIRPRPSGEFPLNYYPFSSIKRTFKRPSDESSQLFSLLLNSPLLFIILTPPLEIFRINYSSALIRSGYIKHRKGILRYAFNLFYTDPLSNVNSQTMKRADRLNKSTWLNFFLFFFNDRNVNEGGFLQDDHWNTRKCKIYRNAHLT